MTVHATNQDIPVQKNLEWLRVLLPIEHEKTPIEVLRNANSQTMCHPQTNPVFAEEHKKLSTEQECLQKVIADLLPSDKKMLVNDFEDIVNAVATVENRMIYRQVLKDGFLLAIELFGGGV